MKTESDTMKLSRQARIAALIETLHETEQQLEALTGGEVDTVANHAGRIFLLRSAEEQLRQQEAQKQMALLNALPAHIAVLDADGRIVAVNEAWRRFANENGLRDAHHSVGRNYLDACGPPVYGDASEMSAVAAGLRAVLAGESSSFSIEYNCNSPTEQRWFLLMVTPLATDRRAGAVVMHINVSASVRSEQALRDSKAMLDIAGRSAKVGGWILDLTQNRLHWSDMVAIMHDQPAGYSPPPELGWADFAPAHIATVRAAVDRCIASGVPYDLEGEKISATGRRFWVRTIGEAVRDAEGRIVRIQGALQDITDRKLASLQMQKLAHRLSNTLEAITDAFFTVDADWRFTYVNHQAERLWERESNTTVGRVLWEVFPEAVGSVFEPLYRRAMGGETGITCEEQYLPLGKWFGAEFHPLDDGLSVYFRDVTEARRARQQLELLEASVAQLNDVVMITEPAPELKRGRRIVFVNDAFVRLTGYAREEVIGRCPSLLDGPSTDPAELARIRGMVERFEPVHTELMRRAKDGRECPVEIDITPVATAGKGITHTVSVMRDISERRRSEEALRELNASLEERVRHRTQELELARELAEQANRAKSSFLAMMSHEIRTPMNCVIGMIEVLEESPLQANQRDMVKTVRESAYALLSIVDDVLDFSKIEAGQFTIDHAPMDLTEVVEGVGDALCRLSENQGVGLRLYIDPRLPTRMLGDAGRLRQVLMNLVGNAVKFSSGQGRRGLVSLRAQRVASGAGGDTLELVVDDNGVGMDVDTLARLFSPFTQADASTTRRFGGTGLGLSISHRLVTLMGGEITVSSAVDQGSTFTVYLPIMLPPGDDAASVAPASTQLTGLPCLLLGAADLTTDLADYLNHAGCAVRCASALAEGLACLRDLAPGCCVVVVASPPEGVEPVVAACRSLALQRPGMVLAFVIIKTGRRLRSNRQKPDRVELDGECLHRTVFLRGVALASCREGDSETAEAPAAVAVRAASPDPARPVDTDPLILLAEDNEVNQQVLTKQLSLLGYSADIVSNGVEALARWRRGGHALLLTDLHMPEMDGYMLAEAVRAEEVAGGARLPILALTANALRDEELRCRQAGMDGYLTKPLRLAQLKAAIDAWLRPAPAGPGVEVVVEAASFASPAVDLSVLADLLGDDPQVMRNVLASFRTSTKSSALAMAKAHASGVVQGMSDVAHKLKSTARAIGAVRLGQICADIEEAARTPHSALLDPLVADFEVELRAVHAFLEKR